jgi:hypothetical protein
MMQGLQTLNNRAYNEQQNRKNQHYLDQKKFEEALNQFEKDFAATQVRIISISFAWLLVAVNDFLHGVTFSVVVVVVIVNLTQNFDVRFHQTILYRQLPCIRTRTVPITYSMPYFK